MKMFKPTLLERKGFMRLIPSVLIVVGIVALSAVISIVVINSAVTQSTNNLTVIGDALHVCEEIPYSSSTRMVILRLDDVQAHSLTDVSIRMMRESTDRGMPIVAGVIPINIGDDEELKYFFKERGCNVEVAQHGYDHSYDNGKLPSEGSKEVAEFEKLNENDAQSRIIKGIDALKTISVRRPTTFIPPQNVISDEGRSALKKEGFSVISSEGLSLYDYDASSWDFMTDTFITHDKIVQACNIAFQTRSTCVIMLHPQDFADKNGKLDSGRYSEYVSLLEWMSASDITAVTFSSIIKNR